MPQSAARPLEPATVRAMLSDGGEVARRVVQALRVALDVGEDVRLKVTDDGVGLPEHVERRSGLDHLVARAERWGGSGRPLAERQGRIHHSSEG